MYAQCPECRTVFRITRAQLDARGGFVRCGQCRQVFDARGTLLDKLPAHAPKRPRGSRTGDTARKKPKITAPALPEGQLPFPDLDLRPKPRLRIPNALWAIATAIAALALIGQFTWANRYELARDQTLEPLFAELCHIVDCGVAAKRDLSAIELLDQTGIAPHPKYENMLRIRAALINREPEPLPFPLMEVALTDSDGKLLVRRSFKPGQYLEQAPARGAMLQQGIVVSALLDVTNPDGRAMGYEIRLLSP
jgi:predicted Zn finger-like uncharacterized protein